MTRWPPKRQDVTRARIAHAGRLIAGAMGTVTEEQRAEDERAAQQLARRIRAMDAPARQLPSEADEQARLTAEVRRTWWGKHGRGYWHIRQETEQRREAHKGQAAGVEPGWPDVILLIPAVDVDNPARYRLPVRAVLELKSLAEAPQRQGRPAPELLEPEWWLQWDPRPIDPLRTSEPTRYGLRWSQARALWLAHQAGFSTMVAYGADAALQWLDRLAGPAPDTLPDRWKVED